MPHNLIKIRGHEELTLYDREGNPHTVPTEEAERLIASGVLAFRRGVRVPIVDVKTGEILSIPSENYRQALVESQGRYRLVTPEVARFANEASAEEYRRFLDEEMGGAAFLSGLSRGLDPTEVLSLVGVPSLSRAVREAIGGEGLREFESEVAEANPEEELAGYLTGFGGSLLAGAGASRVGALGRLAEGTQAGLTLRVGDFARMALNRTGVSNELALNAARAGAEGLFSGLVDASSRAIRDDKPLYSEIVLSEAGLGAALGMGSELAFRGLGRIVRGLGRIRKRGTTVAERAMRAGALDENARRIIEDDLLDPFDSFSPPSWWVDSFVGRGTPIPRNVINALADPRKAKEILKRLKAEPRVSDIARRAAEAGDAIEAALRDVGRTGLGTSKSGMFRDIIEEEISRGAIRPTLLRQEALDEVTRLQEELTSLDKYGAFVGIKGAAKRNSILKAVERTRLFLEEEVSPNLRPYEIVERSFSAVDFLRSELYSILSKTDDVMKGQLSFSLTRLDRFLTDEQSWGRVARIQEEYNRIGDRLGEIRARLQKKFTTERDGKLVHDPGKYMSYFNNEYKPGNDLVIQDLADFFNVGKEYLEFTERVFGRIPERVRAAIDKIELLKKLTSEGAGIMQAVNIIRKAQSLENSFSGLTNLGIPAVVGGLGYAIGGPLGGVLGVSAGNIINYAIFRPVSGLLGKAVLVESTERLLRRMRGAFKKLEARIAGRSVQKKNRALPLLIRPLLSGSINERREAYRTRVLEVQELASDPDEMAARLAASLSGVSKDEPEVSAYIMESAMRGIAYLSATLPRYELDPLNPGRVDFIPSMAEIDAFLARFRAVEDPISVLEDTVDGTVEPEAVEAVQVVYPRLYNEMVAGVQEVIQEHKKEVPYQVRLHLGILYGTPTDASLSPDYLANLQSHFFQTTEQSRAVGQQSAFPRGRVDWSTSTLTELEDAISGPPPR